MERERTRRAPVAGLCSSIVAREASPITGGCRFVLIDGRLCCLRGRYVLVDGRRFLLVVGFCSWPISAEGSPVFDALEETIRADFAECFQRLS